MGGLIEKLEREKCDYESTKHPEDRAYNCAVDDCVALIRQHESEQQEKLKQVQEALLFAQEFAAYCTVSKWAIGFSIPVEERCAGARLLLDTLIQQPEKGNADAA